MATGAPSSDMSRMLVDPTSPTPSAGERAGCKALMSPLMRKRARSPMHLKVQELQRGGEDPDLELDNVRTQKRYLTEMIAADMSKLRVNQQQPTPITSRNRPSFMLPAICLPPSPTPPTAAHMLASGKLSDFMDCDECGADAGSGFIAAYIPAASSNEQPSASPACSATVSTHAATRSISSPSLQQLQREAHESPSSPTDSKLSVDLRKAALIRSLLHKSYCDPAGRCMLPLPPAQRPPEEQPSTSRSRAPLVDSTASPAAVPAAADGPPAADAVDAASQDSSGAPCLQLTPPGTRLQPAKGLLPNVAQSNNSEH